MPAKWPTAFDDTHHDYIDLRDYAFGSIQKAFAKGWLTHNENENEEWRGADYYAHIQYLGVPGYVIGKALELINETNLLSPENPEDVLFAHYAIEVAIDLLLKKNDDPKLGGKLLLANLLRSWQDQHLLVKVLVWKHNTTDWLTLATTELAFRNLVGRYALALALPSPKDKKAIVELAVQLAREMYGMEEVTAGQVRAILKHAIDLCDEDYKDVIDYAIKGIEDYH